MITQLVMAVTRIKSTILAASILTIGCAGRGKLIHDYWNRTTSLRGTFLESTSRVLINSMTKCKVAL